MTEFTQPSIEEIERQLRVLDRKARCLVQIGLLTTLYFDTGHEKTTRLAVFECLEKYVSATLDHLRWAIRPEEETMVQFAPALLPAHRSWLLDLDPDSSWHLEYRGGADGKEASPFSIVAFGVSARMHKKSFLSYVRFTFPMMWFTENGGSIIDWCLLGCEKVKPSSGYGGLGILQPAERSAAFKTDPLVYAIARRFTALEVDIPIEHTLYLAEGIKGVNWLTVVSSKWLKHLGGIEAVRRSLDDQIVFHEYEDGVVIQAGPRPVFGDSNRNERPECYIAVANALRPIRIKTHASFHNMGSGDRFTNETTVDWLQRFDNV